MRTLKIALRYWLAGMVAVLGTAYAAKRRLPVRAQPGDDELSLVSIFDGSTLRSTSAAFRGGAIYSVFGGTNLDLRRAQPDPGGARLEVTTVYGGTDITVPDSWLVTVGGPSVAAAVDVRVADADRLDPSAPRLTINARTILGGLSVVARPVLKPARS